MKNLHILVTNQESSFWYKSAHDRIHTYREQIALQQGTKRERSSLSAMFTQVVRNEHGMLASKAIIDTLNSYVLKYGGMMCGFSILIEPVYRGLGRYANATFEDITGAIFDSFGSILVWLWSIFGICFGLLRTTWIYLVNSRHDVWYQPPKCTLDSSRWWEPKHYGFIRSS